MAFPDSGAAIAALASRSATLADLREIVVAYPHLRSVVAAYPGLDDSLLGWLRDLHDPLVDAQLAKRASAPAPPTVSSSTFPTADTPLTGGIYRDEAPTTAGTPVAAGPGYGGDRPPMPRPPVPPVRPTPPPEVPPTRKIWPVVVIVVAALVVLGGGIGAAFATGLIGAAPATTTSPKPKPTRTPSVEPSPSAAPPSASPSPSASLPPTPATSAPSTTASLPTGFTCWDKSTASTLAGCSRPSGKDADWTYLSYAFPSIATHPDCKKADSTGKSDYRGITLMWECELGDAMIRYRYWEDPSDAVNHYDRKFSAKSTLKTYDLLVGGEPVNGWAKTDKDTAKGPRGVKRVVVTMWLPDHQLSMSAEGNTTKAMWAAFDLVRIRTLDQSLGYPSTDAPAEAPITTQAR